MPATHLHRRILRRAALLRRLQVALGHDLAAMHRSCAFLRHGATSFPLYCETFGLAGVEGLQLEALAKCADRYPALALQVASGRTTLPAAAAVARLLAEPDLLREGDDWLGWAAGEPTRDVLDRVRRRREEARWRRGVFPLRAYLSRRGADLLLRAREVSGRSAGRALSEGETIEVVADDFLDRRDGVRRARRLAARESADRSPPPRPGSRRIPGAEKRKVILEGGDRCRVAGCGNGTFLDYCHRRPFREGGENAAGNLLRLCRLHHRQFDGGEWRVVPRPGGDLLVDRRGIPVGRLGESSGPPEEEESEPQGRAAPAQVCLPPGADAAEHRRGIRVPGMLRDETLDVARIGLLVAIPVRAGTGLALEEDESRGAAEGRRALEVAQVVATRAEGHEVVQVGVPLPEPLAEEHEAARPREAVQRGEGRCCAADGMARPDAGGEVEGAGGEPRGVEPLLPDLDAGTGAHRRQRPAGPRRGVGGGIHSLPGSPAPRGEAREEGAGTAPDVEDPRRGREREPGDEPVQRCLPRRVPAG